MYLWWTNRKNDINSVPAEEKVVKVDVGDSGRDHVICPGQKSVVSMSDVIYKFSRLWQIVVCPRASMFSTAKDGMFFPRHR